MKLNKLVTALCIASLSFPIMANDLVHEARQTQKEQKQQNQIREATFAKTAAEIKQERDALIAARDKLQSQTEAFTTQFTANEIELAKLEEKLRIDSGSLGELFGVVRQTAKTLQAEQSSSVTAIDRQDQQSVVDQIVLAKTLPSMNQLKGLWQSIQGQIIASGEIKSVDTPFINGVGEQSIAPAIRLGAMGLIGQQGYLQWQGDRHLANAYIAQPQNAPIIDEFQTSITAGQSLILDPSRGMILAQLANAPTLADRLEAGGIVGHIILALLAIGLSIAFFRGGKLLLVRSKIDRQLKNPNEISSNPLGRVLSVYKNSSVYGNESDKNVEVLELRLLEAIVDEQQGLEKGISTLKLFAGLAPMLGLLGTVTGMIETFQVITDFGNGDPKVMADGISMALVTTVLGLISAMPLLLAHNILTSQAERIRLILEKQSIGLIAEQAEKNQNLNQDKTNPYFPSTHTVAE